MTTAHTAIDETLLERLAIPYRAKAAFHALMDAGLAAMPLARRGLEHPDPAVRYHCARYFDHFMSERDMAEMVQLLDDPSAGVRSATLPPSRATAARATCSCPMTARCWRRA